jgi:hypothetical protein
MNNYLISYAFRQNNSPKMGSIAYVSECRFRDFRDIQTLITKIIEHNKENDINAENITILNIQRLPI